MLHDHRLQDTSRSGRAIRTAWAAVALAAGIAFSGVATAQSLPVWDDYTFEAQSAVIEQLNQKFQAAHPGVTIQRTPRTFDDLADPEARGLSGNGPEVTKVNQGAGDMGTMVKEKLLLPVDAYIARYGWDKRQSDSVLARDRWSDTGAVRRGPDLRHLRPRRDGRPLLQQEAPRRAPA